MSAPVTIDDTYNTFGPGVLKIGTIGTEIDASCYVNNLQIVPSKDQEDGKTMLCGTEKGGRTTYSYEMSGTLDLDLDKGAAGLFALSQSAPGSTQAFTFTPQEDGVTATGSLILDPLSFGSSDGYGSVMQSDVAFALVGKPVYDYTGIVGGAGAATGATAGAPGTFTPSGATPPADLAALQSGGVVATPNSAWTTGQSVNLGTGSAHWTGAAWATGSAA
jgi:hypothetical protein